MNNDLISREALKKAIQADIDMGDNACDTGYLNAMDICLEYIDNAPTVDPKDYKWFDCIDNKLLKSRHGDFVIYKVDFLLDNLTREVYIMEGARKMRGKK